MSALRSPLLLLVGLLAAVPLTAQRAASPAAPSARALAGVTERGRAMARFQVAAGTASRALLSIGPDSARVRQYVVRETPTGWLVRFGALSAARDTFYEAYVVTSGVDSAPVAVLPRPVGAVAPDVDRAAAAASRLAQEAFGAPTRPYNTFVLAGEAGEWLVYLLPAQTRAGVYPHGGDVRYRVSSDGGRILETHRMHGDVEEVPVTTGETHVHGPTVDGVPEDSDVYFVLTRTPRVPERIAGPAVDFRIDVDGTITTVRHAAHGAR